MKPKFQIPSLTRITLTLALPLSTLISIACQKQFLKENSTDNRAATLAAALSASDKQKVSGTIDQASGRLTAAMSSSALVTQEVSPNGDSNLAGVLLKFPPGSLAIDTNIALQESVPIATSSAAASLGLSGSVTAVGLPLAVQPSVLVDPAQPFIIALQLPPGAGLRLASGFDNLVVMYKANVYAKKQILSGILPRSALTIEGDSVRFPSRYFGAFQIAYTETLVEQAKEVEAATPVQTKYEVAALPALSITSRSPYVVRAAETVTLNGKNFRPSMILALGGKLVSQLRVLSDVSASFIVPTAMAAGGLTLTAEQDGSSQSISLLFTPGASGTPVITLAPAEVCAGLNYYDATGNLQVGIKPCAAPLADCAADGATGCVANGTYKAAAVAGLPSKVVSGSTVAGIVGTATAESHSNCSVDGATGCVAVTNYTAAATTGLASKVLSGSIVAGVTGNVTLPAIASVLTGTSFGVSGTGLSGTLTLPTAGNVFASSGVFGVAGIGSAPTLTLPSAANVRVGNGTFGVAGSGISPTLADCSSDGTTGCVAVTGYPAAKTADFSATNIQAGFKIAGVAGTATISSGCTADGQLDCTVSGIFRAANVTGFGAWDLRSGLTLGGISGALKTNCRNSGNSTYFNYDGAVGSIGTAGVTTGTTYEYWDTIDDFNGFPANKVAAWSSDTVCDSSVWQDVTTTNGGSTTTTCAASPASCQYKDKITNLVTTKVISTALAWNTALSTCNSSTYGGYAAGTWRLPTQKELMSMYEHGITSLDSANFMTLANMRNYFWSSSTYSYLTTNAWTVTLATGTTDNFTKTSAYYVVCVR